VTRLSPAELGILSGLKRRFDSIQFSRAGSTTSPEAMNASPEEFPTVSNDSSSVRTKPLASQKIPYERVRS